MSLSWKKSPDSIAIAITNSKDPKYNDKILYLSRNKNDENLEKKSLIGKLHEIETMVLASNIEKKTSAVKKIFKAYSEDIPICDFDDVDSTVVEVYKRIVGKGAERLITLENATFEFVPLMKKDLKDGNYRQSIFISGMAGSGKSYWLKRYVLLYHEEYPKNKIYFISQQDLKDDESLEEIKSFTTQITESQLIGNKDNGEEPLQWTDIPKNSLILLDDYDAFPKKKKGKEPSLYEIVHDLLNNILINGRKHYISIVASSHELNKTHKNETIMKEMEYFVLFPDGIMLYHLNYFGTKYLGLSKEKIKQLKNCKSRWVLIRRKVPMIELSEYTAQILK